MPLNTPNTPAPLSLKSLRIVEVSEKISSLLRDKNDYLEPYHALSEAIESKRQKNHFLYLPEDYENRLKYGIDQLEMLLPKVLSHSPEIEQKLQAFTQNIQDPLIGKRLVGEVFHDLLVESNELPQEPLHETGYFKIQSNYTGWEEFCESLDAYTDISFDGGRIWAFNPGQLPFFKAHLSYIRKIRMFGGFHGLTVEELTELFQQCNHLKVLNLELWRLLLCTPEQLNAIFGSLRGIKILNLIGTDLDAELSRLSNEQIQAIFSHLQKLRILNLDGVHLNGLSPAQWHLMHEPLISLKTFEMNASICNMLREETFQAMCESLRNLDHIRLIECLGPDVSRDVMRECLSKLNPKTKLIIDEYWLGMIPTSDWSFITQPLIDRNLLEIESFEKKFQSFLSKSKFLDMKK